MRHLLAAGVICAVLFTASAAAAVERMLTGAGIGAGTGAVVAGPPGALVGAVVGAWVGGPRVTGRSYRTCWYDENGRHCRWR